MRGKLIVALAVVLCALAVFAAPQGPGLSTSLSVDKWHHGLSDEVAIEFSLTNDGRGPVTILKWHTPLEGLLADLFVVTRDGQPVPYTGRLVKRPAPTPADFVRLAPGETLSVRIDLSAYYDMSVTGEYTVTFDGPLALFAPLASNSVTFFVEGKDTPQPGLDVESIGGYYSCTNTQQSTLQTAHANALTMSDRSGAYLAAYGNSERYRWWFGAYSTKNFNTVKSHYTAISDAFANKSVTYDCACTDNYYAYVYPTRPYRIYLCRVFWQAPATGRDSKAGTLVHEMSHFRVVASTDDYVYGATGAHNLALSSPRKAIDNADNHEYFAEDSY